MTSGFIQSSQVQRQAAFAAWMASRAQRAARLKIESPRPGVLEFRGHGRLLGSSLGTPRTRVDFVKGIDKVHIPSKEKFGPRTIWGDSSGPGFTLLTGYDPDRLLDESGNLTSRRCKCKDKVSFILIRADSSKGDSYQLRCKKCMGVIKSKCDSTGKPIKGSGK